MATQEKPHDAIIDDFRATVRTIASSKDNKGIPDIIHEIFDKYSANDSKDNKSYISNENFESACLNVRSIRAKFSKEDLIDIFDECDTSQAGKVTIQDLIDFCQRTISKARVLALKVRSSIIHEFQGKEVDYRRLFASLCSNDSQYADKVPFIELVEDMLDMNITDNDGLAIYSLFDGDGDGKVSVDDFLGFIVGQSPEASRALESRNVEVIIDLKISINSVQDAEYIRSGYEQLLPDSEAWRSLTNGASSNIGQQGSFGKGQSIWIWRKRQGTCFGRLKPIIDIQIDSSSTSSSLVLSGYTCIPQQIAGQWVWIKRAFRFEEESDAISDLRVTLGNMKNPGDKIWSSPGVGWIRVDGNLAKTGIFSSFDGFLWFCPVRARSLDIHLSSPIRSVVGLSEENRLGRVLAAVRTAIRHYSPLEEMKKLNVTGANVNASTVQAPNVPKIDSSQNTYDFVTLFNKYTSKGTLSHSKFTSLLLDIGIRMEAVDVDKVFRLLDVSSNGFISREEFTFMLKLSEHEIDLVVNTVRNKLFALAYRTQASIPPDPSQIIQSSSSNIIAPMQSIIPENVNKIRESKTLRDIFALINRNGDGILSLEEILEFHWFNLDIFITEEEGLRIIKAMDIDGDDKIEEKDFISFMKNASSPQSVFELSVKKAQRLHTVSGLFRRWLQRNSNPNVARVPLSQDKQWVRRHEYVTKTRFPGFLSSIDIFLATTKLGVHLSFHEAKQLVLIVSPERAGRIQNEDLDRYVKSTCRSFGELLAILSKESIYLKGTIEACKKLRDNTRLEGYEDKELAEKYSSTIKDIIKRIQGDSLTSAVALPTASGAKPLNTLPKHDVVSIAQVKAGFESRGETRSIINLEEWASLAILVGADVADEDSHGIRLREFIDGVTKLIVNGGLTTVGTGSISSFDGIDDTLDEKATLSILSMDIIRMIHEEAKSAAGISGKKSNKKGQPDYHAAFDLFDEDGQGTISVDEFKHMLLRLQLVDKVSDRILTLLLSKFDTKKKGFITFDDFLGFVNSNKNLLDDDESIFEESPYDSVNESNVGNDLDIYGLASQTPPVTITRNSDCDWFVWHLYRQACRIDLSDPESIITELEASCAETEELSQLKGSINAYELWDLLHELKLLTGSLTKAQYDNGIAYLLMEKPSKKQSRFEEQEKSSEEVDYEALCRYIVRMGRAFNSKVQEQKKVDDKRYIELKTILRKELLSDVENNPNKSEGGNLPKFEKVFRRLDLDGDGMVTMQEFKTGLKKLRLKDEKEWNLKMIRRLFNDLDSNHDNRLSVQEISNYLREGAVNNDSKSNNKYPDYPADDDFDDDQIFQKQKGLSDGDLFRKVNQILQDLVPLAPRSNPSNHIETVKDAIRRFFQRADTENRGIVPEERFRAFLRKSSLQDRLSAGEVRKLTEKIRRKRIHDANLPKDQGRYSIDYERFIRLISNVQVSHPLGKAEGVLLRFQSAVNDSARAGRPFLGLCSLIDSSMTGQITTSELIHTSKIMGCILTQEDIDSMKELLPRTAVGRNPDTKEEIFDYKEILYSVQNFSPRASANANFDFDVTASLNRSLSARSGTASPFDFSKQIQLQTGPGITTPLGLTLSDANLGTTLRSQNNPYRSVDSRNDSSGRNLSGGIASLIRGGREGGGVMKYDKILRLIADRIIIAVDDVGMRQGIKYNLKNQFEYYDRRNEGLVNVRDLSNILDEIGITLSVTELAALQATFVRPEDNRIDYIAFFEMYLPQYLSAPVTSVVRSSFQPKEVQHTPPIQSSGVLSYSHPRVIERWRVIRGEGREPRSYFATFDYDKSGMIDRQRFREVIQKLQILQTEHQLSKAMDDFQSLSDPNTIMYEDFCSSIETLVDGDPSAYGNRRYVDGNGYDGLALRKSGGLATAKQTQNETERWKDAYDNLNRFRASQGFDSSQSDRRERDRHIRQSADHRGYPIDLDDGAEGNWNTRDGNGSHATDLSRRYQSPSKFRATSRYDADDDESLTETISRPRSRAGSFSSIAPPRSSPSKVGSKIWGNQTSIDKKGRAPRVGDDTWCCAVCMYVENPVKSNVCVICNSPNYSVMKDFQLKEQCVSCTFLNGQFAEECEMCGEPLSTRTKH